MEGMSANAIIVYSLLILLNSIILTTALGEHGSSLGITDMSNIKYDDKSKDVWKDVFKLSKKPIDRLDVSCPALEMCLQSEKFLLVCGSDLNQYWNPGVLQCAQICNPTLKMTNFGFCKHLIATTTTEAPKVAVETEGEIAEQPDGGIDVAELMRGEA